ncbi:MULTISPECIES: tartrate dehydrogenase [Streptomyces]|uniref:D-malate dehydrogenase (decarboxylating) n=2 Tax=Streptomyces rimosus subsp. rimosus TaxID=132474 RepID=L8EUY3_STRR1|nr:MULTISPECIES: tartrate dehydrogenase [Streptomyces]KOG73202.1 tartrate dehydrogenase [Kitasatospora aureofaciens]MYT43710.1 tartrate dehydrogenase [Streptomyces sp. SID5471]KOT39562.1 tartrate dehydrogenase [Streptomyces sp. NRRL WC-3701]KOT57416.1 tartrate dehydrogenase [Streptomyces rimosus subsp. rimosus]KOT62217.1 tartrate dehydrogenase [Streptomyces rimosus subsp. rimosus]
MTNHRIALIPGDGIGTEVLPPAQRVLDTVGRRHGFTFSYTSFDDWSCERYLREGAMMPPDGLDRLRDKDAILLGAVGRPDVPDHVSLWGLLIPIRRGFRQYVNLRPVRVFEGIDSPVRGAVAGKVDLVVVRENVEGEYSEIGGRLHRGFPEEAAVQESVFTRAGVTRVLDHAFALAAGRRGRLTSATKSNGIVHTLPFWDELVAECGAAHPEVAWDQEHIDALAAKFVLDPARFDVVVASNLFGDILSDLAAAVAGSIGIAPAANLNPEREFPSMFEPVHGSAPDIAGRGIANPLGAIWSAALMLDHLGHPEAAADVTDAIAAVLAKTDVRTPDLGGTAATAEFTDRLLELL